MATRRLELGFEGGTVLRLTVDEALVGDVPGSILSGSGRWASVSADEGTLWVDRDRIVYVRVPPGEVSGRVGFGNT
ncbi:MAG: hypothetical protein ACLGG9_10910 [Thermoleophilia bacterium]|jgi:hypothetical protein